MAYYATYMPDETGEMQKVVINAGVGFVLPYYGETAPPGTLACDGSEISREAYKELFQVLGTKAGAGDGSTTFNLPDLRGMFVRGTGGNAAALGVEQGDAIRNARGYMDSVYSAARYSGLPSSTGILKWGPKASQCSATTTTPSNASSCWDINLNFDGVVPTAAENRPINVALLMCIVYE